MARTLDQGSRLSATRLARQRETDFLRLGKFSENDLYKNLDWIAAHQQRIENLLYQKRHGNKPYGRLQPPPDDPAKASVAFCFILKFLQKTNVQNNTILTNCPAVAETSLSRNR